MKTALTLIGLLSLSLSAFAGVPEETVDMKSARLSLQACRNQCEQQGDRNRYQCAELVKIDSSDVAIKNHCVDMANQTQDSCEKSCLNEATVSLADQLIERADLSRDLSDRSGLNYEVLKVIKPSLRSRLQFLLMNN